VADNEKKPVINFVPAILTGTAALIAALTTVYVNLRNDLKDDPAPPTVATVAAPAEPEATKPAGPKTVHLQLQRIAVQQDGAVGNADWRFAIEADGQPLFAFQQDAMTSEGGRNIVVAANDRDANAELDLAPGKPIAITVKGWRGGWFKKADEPLVMGEGWLTSTGALSPIKVIAQDEKDGAFTFYLSASPEKE
jgi:hypothetical protein